MAKPIKCAQCQEFYNQKFNPRCPHCLGKGKQQDKNKPPRATAST